MKNRIETDFLSFSLTFNIMFMRYVELKTVVCAWLDVACNRKTRSEQKQEQKKKQKEMKRK